MNKNMKILGVLLALAITGLSVENALTGHGIKGNKNLNPEILASGSSGGSGSSGDTGDTGGSEDPGTWAPLYTPVSKVTSEKWGNWVYGVARRCRTFDHEYWISCDPGGSSFCTPHKETLKGEHCEYL